MGWRRINCVASFWNENYKTWNSSNNLPAVLSKGCKLKLLPLDYFFKWKQSVQIEKCKRKESYDQTNNNPSITNQLQPASVSYTSISSSSNTKVNENIFCASLCAPVLAAFKDLQATITPPWGCRCPFPVDLSKQTSDDPEKKTTWKNRGTNSPPPSWQSCHVDTPRRDMRRQQRHPPLHPLCLAVQLFAFIFDAIANTRSSSMNSWEVWC